MGTGADADGGTYADAYAETHKYREVDWDRDRHLDRHWY